MKYRQNRENFLATDIASDKISQLPPPARFAIAAAVILIAVLALYFFGRLCYRMLYRDNTAFCLAKIDIVTDSQDLRRAVTFCLDANEVVTGRTTLPQIPVGKIRQELLRNPRLSEVELHRIYPDSLRIILRAHTPVAILRFHPRYERPDLKIDSNGCVVPADLEGNSSVLPTIIGLEHPEKYIPGQEVTDPGVLAFLHFLRECRLRPEGAMYEVTICKLDPVQKEMQLLLDARGPFRQSARIIMPYDNVAENFNRLNIVAKLNLENRQTIGYLNATFEHIPVRP